MALTPGYRQTEIGVIPESWAVQLLGTLATTVASGRSSAGRAAGLYSVYGSTGVIGYATTPDYEGNAILVARVGANAGKLNLVSGKYGVTDNTIILRLNDSHCLLFFWQQLEIKRLNSLVYGSGQPLITGTMLKALSVAVPSFPEQIAIATALSEADALTEALEQLVAKKRHIKQGAMQEFLTGKKRLPGFQIKPGYKQTEVGVIPEDWDTPSLGELLTRVANGLVYKSGKTTRYPVTRIETIADSSINLDRVGYAEPTADIEKYRVQPGDILFSHINSVDHIGKVAIYRGGDALYHGMNLLLLRAESRVNSNYLHLWLGSAGARKKAATLAKRAVSQASINTGELRAVLVPLPPTLAEQTAIATVLSDMDTEIDALETKLTKTRQIKQGMMHNLLTGRIRLI